MEEATVAKEARKEALKAQLDGIRSGDVAVPSPDGTTQQGSAVGGTEEEKMARRAALSSQLHAIRSGDVPQLADSARVPAGGLTSVSQSDSSTGIESGTSPEAPHSDATRDDSQMQVPEAGQADKCAAVREREAAAEAAASKRKAALAWESAAHKAEFFARAARFAKAAHEKAHAEAEAEAAAAAAKKAEDEKARGAERLAAAEEGESLRDVETSVWETSRLFDHTATNFKSRCCVSILCLVCVAILLVVLLVTIDGATMAADQVLLAVLIAMFAVINGLLGLCWLLNCGWMEGKRFRIRGYDENELDYDGDEPMQP